MIATVRARLRGQDVLVWPWDKRYGPEWMPTYADGEVPYDSEIGRLIVDAYQRSEAVVYQDQKYWVENLEIDVEPE